MQRHHRGHLCSDSIKAIDIERPSMPRRHRHSVAVDAIDTASPLTPSSSSHQSPLAASYANYLLLRKTDFSKRSWRKRKRSSCRRWLWIHTRKWVSFCKHYIKLKAVLTPLLPSQALLLSVQVETGVEQGLGQLYISLNRPNMFIHGMGHFHHHFRHKISLQLSTKSIDLSRYLNCNGKFMTYLNNRKEFSVRYFLLEAGNASYKWLSCNICGIKGAVERYVTCRFLKQIVPNCPNFCMNHKYVIY